MSPDLPFDLSFDGATFATAFAVIFLAELPDKTMFASLAMGTRMRAPWVWLGTSSAFLVHVAVAVAAGSAFALLPEPLVHAVAAALFAFGAYTLLRGGGDEDGDAEEAGGRAPRITGFWRTYVTAFTVVFISEWGDLTQITTANLAATRGPLPVALGALLALMSVSALALVAGRFIADRVPLRVVQRVGGAVMAALAVWSLLEAIL
ncbi:TMEM165/GDT1 family protein [Actinomadura sp. SCN-SB]|uniref:TMEM165/GDT1 family protein n=1 Tax=Actinomadura sp. SCN-SB TaxID=3373092 RepID=UPI0037532CAA